MIVDCIVCGKPHKVKPSVYGSGGGLYCSRVCAGRGRWQNPDYRAAQIAKRTSDEFKLRMSEVAVEMWQDGRLGNEDWRKRHSEIATEIQSRPGRREAESAATSEAWASGRLGGQGWRQANAEGKRIAWANGRYGANRNLKVSISKRGGRNPAWCGGASKRLHAHGFGPALKRQIRARDGHRCILCGMTEKPGRGHDVHHIDYDKANHRPDNLITLCKSCHARTNFDRDHWLGVFAYIIEETRG